MKITVVTVCLNVEETIEATIQSVLAQTYQDIEYLIIDGMSNDGTINIINKYVNDKRIRFFSEKDNGIYNAMNKALGICTGKYIIYMNSGDVFYDDKVLEDMVPNFQYDLVYGNALIKTRLGDKLETYQGKWKMIYWLFIGRMMSHQSLFVKTDIMHLYQFNECFQIRADYDFIIRALKDKRSLKYIDRNVCIVEGIDGISAQVKNFDLMRNESDISLKENFAFIYYLLKMPKELIRFFKRIMEKKK